MRGARWHGYDDPKRMLWTVDNCPRNIMGLKMMIGLNPYEWFDRPLETHEYVRPLHTHQKHMSEAGLTYHYQTWGAELGCISGDTLVQVH